MSRPRSLPRLRLDTLHRMGDRFRVKVVSVVALLAVAATGVVMACGSDEGGGQPACEGPTCDGGSVETSTPDGSQPQPDGSQPEDAGSDADADGAIVETCEGGAPGTLDESFGEGGIVRLGYATSSANAVAVQPDGRIVIGGDTPTGPGDSLALVRLMPNGALDTTFGTNGLVETTVGTVSQTIKGVVLQPDGKIVAAGRSRGASQPFSFTVLRHQASGVLDPSFGDGGVVLTDFAPASAYGESVVLQPDGRILVGGYREQASSDFILARYNADGSLDANFGVGGRVTIDVRATADANGNLALMPDGRLVIGGSSVDPADGNRSDMAASRVLADGGLDNSFGTAGKFMANFGGGSSLAFALAVDSTGRTLLGGARKSGVPDDLAVVRLTSSGVADPSWGTGGLVTTDFAGRGDVATALTVQEDGRIIAVGTSGVGTSIEDIGIVLARYLPNGALDNTFGTAGKTLTKGPPNTNLAASAAVLSKCTVTVVGMSDYDLNTANPKYSMVVLRYRR